jgi:hypothetical protein
MSTASLFHFEPAPGAGKAKNLHPRRTAVRIGATFGTAQQETQTTGISTGI